MAEDLTKGLNILLHPKFLELQQRVERLESFHQDLAVITAQKEDRQEVQHLRDHLDGQIRAVDSSIGMVKDKMLSLDELRSQEIRGLSKGLEQRATLANLNHVSEHLQATNLTLSTKAELAKVEQLGKQLHALSEELATRATISREEQLAKELQSLKDTVARKVDLDITDKLIERMKTLAGEVELRAEDARVTELSRKHDAFLEELRQKADESRIEQVHRQLNVLSEDVASRAEARKVDHMCRQLHSLGEQVIQKAEAGTADQAIRQIHALSDSVAQKVEGSKHNLLSDQVSKLREDVFSMKAHVAKLDEHSRQLENLHNAQAVDSARLKHLCVMYGGAGAQKDGAHATTSPGRLQTEKKQHEGQLPSLTGSLGPSKDRASPVSLPSMAPAAVTH